MRSDQPRGLELAALLSIGPYIRYEHAARRRLGQDAGAHEIRGNWSINYKDDIRKERTERMISGAEGQERQRMRL